MNFDKLEIYQRRAKRIQDILSVLKVSRTSFRALAIGNNYGVSYAEKNLKVSYLLKLR